MNQTSKRLIFTGFVSLFLSGVLYFTINLWKTLRYHDIEIRDRILMVLHFRPAVYLLITALVFCLFLFLLRYGRQTGEFLYRFRYPIAIGIWILCILFKLNGSSIAEWTNYLGLDQNISGLLLGSSRSIRTDELATYTPMMLSQAFNPSGAFSYFSEILRGTATDTFMVYGLPVRDVAVLFRPFHWGFLFLGLERGFSFYWCGRIITLMMVSFEMGMLITKKNRRYAVLISLMMTLSPTIQWWIGVNSLVEMLVFGQLAVLLVYHYMHTEKMRFRFLIGLGLVLCAGGFILSVYPAWQVPIGYMVLALLLWVILENWREFNFRFRYDIPLILVCLAILGIGMLYVFTKSSDMIAATANTVYPGQRISSGGGEGFQALRYGGNLFLTIISGNILNPCEMTAFFSFAPLGILLALYVVFREKQRDRLLIILLAVYAFLGIYMIWDYPSFLAKITLLSHSASGRITQIIGILDIFLLFRSLTLLQLRPKRIPAAAGSLLLAGILTILNRNIYGEYLSTTLSLGLFLALFCGFFLLLCSKEKWEGNLALLYTAFLLFIAGGLVNPVQKGFSFLYETALMQDVMEIVEEDPTGLWICDNIGYPMNDFAIMGGAPTIDSINIYPTMERWALLDEDGAYEDIYNRYAHITTILQQTETTFSEGGMLDSFFLHLDVQDLETLNVSYVMSNRNLEELNEENVRFTKLAQDNGYSIYKVSYH